MNISIGSYKVRVEILVAIVVVFCIIFGYLLYDCCKMNLFEGMNPLQRARERAQQAIAKAATAPSATATTSASAASQIELAEATRMAAERQAEAERQAAERQANTSAYIKTFVNSSTPSLWTILNYENTSTTPPVPVPVLTPSYHNIKSVYIPGDLFVDGSIISPSDINLKTNISLLDVNITDKLMNLKPSSFVFKDDLSIHIHYS